jgi:hypothetical protein
MSNCSTSPDQEKNPHMMHVLVHHKVKDYPEWKKIFDGHAMIRQKSGSGGGHLFRRSGDSNDLFILFEWDTPGNAKKFFESDDLKNVMSRAGVIGRPDVHFLDTGEKFIH